VTCPEATANSCIGTYVSILVCTHSYWRSLSIEAACRMAVMLVSMADHNALYTIIWIAL